MKLCPIIHIHIFLGAKLRINPRYIVRTLKSITARKLFKKYSSLKLGYWDVILWSKGYLEKVSAETNKNYQEQKTK